MASQKYNRLLADAAPLWDAYFASRADDDRNRVFMAYKPFLDAFVANLARRARLAVHRLDDALATGYLFFLEAVGNCRADLHPVQRQKYLLTTVRWKLFCYFATKDRGLLRNHLTLLQKRGLSIQPLDTSIDVAAPEDTIGDLADRDDVQLLYRALELGMKTGRLSPQERQYIEARARGEKLLNVHQASWRKTAFLRFQALVHEQARRQFGLSKKLRAPATRFKWGADERGEEIRVKEKLQEGYMKIKFNDVENPWTALLEIGGYTFLCFRPNDPKNDAEQVAQSKWDLGAKLAIKKLEGRDVLQTQEVRDSDTFWYWLELFLDHSQSVRYFFGDGSKIDEVIHRGEKGCLEQLRARGVILL